ncbi:MAG: transporter substrate-binding domain-containing protein [Desulfobacterales bacterium]|nr:transporter substrate-binding domain-containing protein [Desulfobacterales bacterium]
MLYLLVCFPAWAQPIQIVTEEFPPYNYTLDGKVTGLSTEVVQAVVVLLDIPSDINVYPWARAYIIAQQDPNTLIFSIARSADREHLFQWVGPVAPVQTCLFALKERSDIQFNSLEEARQYYIITQLKGRTAQRLVKLGFVEGKNLFSTISVSGAFLMLRSGRGDLLGYPELVMYHAIKKTDLKPEKTVRKVYCFSEVSELYAAFSLQTSPEVVKAFQNGLATIKENGTYQKILEKYLK